MRARVLSSFKDRVSVITMNAFFGFVVLLPASMPAFAQKPITADIIAPLPGKVERGGPVLVPPYTMPAVPKALSAPPPSTPAGPTEAHQAAPSQQQEAAASSSDEESTEDDEGEQSND